MAEFKLPELGENITTGTVTRVMVKVGDTVEKEQPVLELETEKAVVEVPSDVAGTVTEVRVKEGDTVTVGQVLLVLGEAAEKPEAPEKEPPKPQPRKEEAPERAVTERAAAAAIEEPAGAEPTERRAAVAAPSVRRLAREMGVDLGQVTGSGPGGRISAADLKAQAGKKEEAKPPEQKPEQPPSEQPAPAVERDRYGEVSREPMSGIRKKTMEHISIAWETIPHVTQMDSADITELEKFRKLYGKHVEDAGGKLTMTVLIMKVVAEALKRFKQFNSFVDVENEQILFKHYINIGVAVDTQHGLMVPVVRDADKKSLTELALEVGQLAERARSRKVAIEDLQGGTFTITNLGGIGGLWFTPIIREPEVAILGVSRARMEPVWIDDNFEARPMLPLSLSYDHRVIDGADAARFIRWLVEALEHPLRMALE